MTCPQRVVNCYLFGTPYCLSSSHLPHQVYSMMNLFNHQNQMEKTKTVEPQGCAILQQRALLDKTDIARICYASKGLVEALLHRTALHEPCLWWGHLHHCHHLSHSCHLVIIPNKWKHEACKWSLSEAGAKNVCKRSLSPVSFVSLASGLGSHVHPPPPSRWGNPQGSLTYTEDAEAV